MAGRYAILRGNVVTETVSGIPQPPGSIELEDEQLVEPGSIWDGESFQPPAPVDPARLNLARRRLGRARTRLRAIFAQGAQTQVAAQARADDNTLVTLLTATQAIRQSANWIAQLADAQQTIVRMLLDLALVEGQQTDDGVE